MEKFKLNTGYEAPMIGLGTYLIQGTKKTNQVIDDALTAGYRLFDTAHMYNNEEYLGAAFKELLSRHNLKREDIFITTKIVLSTEFKTEADYEKLVKSSLKRLQTDYIDLFLLHWPGVTGLSNNSLEVIKYRHESWTALSNIKSRGLIRSIGVSNFMIKHLEALKAFSDVKPVLNQVEWHPKCHDPELLKYCNENGILLQAYSSLGTSSDNSLKNDKIIMKIAQELGKSPSQILLKWSVQSGVAIIPKASSMKHLEENINLDFIIPDDKMKILNNFEDRERLDWNPNNVI